MHTGSPFPPLSAFVGAGGLSTQIETISHLLKESLFPLLHPGPGTSKPSSQAWPWGAFLGHESVTTTPHEVGTASSQGTTAQSILVGSFLRCLVSRTILARDRRIGTAMGRKSGM